jgi:hypothetical protein
MYWTWITRRSSHFIAHHEDYHSKGVALLGTNELFGNQALTFE